MFYMVSFAYGHYKTGDCSDYRTVNDNVKTVQGVHNAVRKHQQQNNLDNEYDYMYNISECAYDEELEGGFEIVESMNYEEWAQINHN